MIYPCVHASSFSFSLSFQEWIYILPMVPTISTWQWLMRRQWLPDKPPQRHPPGFDFTSSLAKLYLLIPGVQKPPEGELSTNACCRMHTKFPPDHATKAFILFPNPDGGFHLRPDLHQSDHDANYTDVLRLVIAFSQCLQRRPCDHYSKAATSSLSEYSFKSSFQCVFSNKRLDGLKIHPSR